jgi:hypothetical protein
MALVHAFSPDIVGNGALNEGGNGGGKVLLDSDWTYTENNLNCYAQVRSSTRLPLIGYGGSYRAIRMRGTTFGFGQKCYMYSPNPSFPAQADGIIQFHLYIQNYGYNDDGYTFFALRTATGGPFEARFNTNGTISFYYWTGSAMAHGLTTSDVVTLNGWHTLAIRFKAGTALSGLIWASIDGGPVAKSASLSMGGVYSWCRYVFMSDTSYTDRYYTQISVFDDISEAMVGTQKWVTQLRPTGDASAPDTDWTGTPSSTPNLHDDVNQIDYVTSSYCSTVEDPADELRFYPDYTETPGNGGINAAWDPPVIDGIVANAIMRGDGTLNQGSVVVETGGTPLPGDVATINSAGSLVPPKVYATKPSGGAWTKTDLTGTAAEFGVKAE